MTIIQLLGRPRQGERGVRPAWAKVSKKQVKYGGSCLKSQLLKRQRQRQEDHVQSEP
jgi:hypothetical protein